MLEFARGRNVSDERDRVFALSSLMPAKVPDVLRPDYDTPIHDVMREASRHCFCHNESLTCNDFGRMPSTTRELAASGSRPTWVTDWSNPCDEDSLSWSFTACGEHSKVYAMNNEEMAAYWSPRDREELVLKGFVAASVGRISAVVLDQDVTIETFLACIQAAEDLIGTTSSRLSTSAHMAFIAVLIAGSDGAYTPVDDAYLREADELLKHVRASRDWLAASDYLRCLNRLIDRRVFSTTSGSLGLGPPCTESSDVIALLLGCRWPAILRPMGQNLYRCVGVSYIHGMMFGEVYEAHKAVGGTFDIIRLC